jgi:transcriptional regulator with XRE-family HTH domain
MRSNLIRMCHMSTDALPNRLRELRRARGMTQDALARLVNTSHATIQRLETGRRRLTDEWANLIAPALHCSPNELFCGAVKPISKPVRHVPQVSWVKASELAPEPHTLEEGDYERLIPYPSNRSSLIALEVTSDSMDRVASPGSIIIVDIEDRELVDGGYYIFRRHGDTTFKQYRASPSRLKPRSYNDEHETIYLDGLENAEEPDLQVVGRVTDVHKALV